MGRYVDGIIIPVPKRKLKEYKRRAEKMARIFKRNGAVEYVEMIADEISKGKSTSFPRSVKLKSGETVVFGYASYKSKAHRDKVWARMHKDKEMMEMWEDDMPFDGMRMIWGGFKSLVEK